MSRSSRADDAVEVLVERDRRAHPTVVRAQVARRGVRQAHTARLPVGVEKLPHEAQHHAQRQLDALARGAVRLAGLHFLADEHHGVEVLDHQRQRAVEQLQVAHQHVERIAQRRLLALGFVLELAVVPTLATQWLIPRLPDFSQLHPNITVNLSARSQPFSLQEHAYDAAIYFGDQFWPYTRGGLVFSEGEMAPICSPAFRDAHAQWDEAGFERCRHVHLSTRAHAWRDWYAQQEWEYTVHASRGPRYELFTMVVAAASAGMGTGLAPRILVEQELRTGELVIPVGRHLDVHQGYDFAYPEGRPASGALGQFKQWVLGLTPA